MAEKGHLTTHPLTAELEEGCVEGQRRPVGVLGASRLSPAVGGAWRFLGTGGAEAD